MFFKNIFHSITILLFAIAVVNGRRRGRIIGGDIINIEAAPFMVALEYLDRQICGGAILNENWTVTAAHCFGKIFLTSQAIIRVGSGLRRRDGSVHYLQTLIKHPGFVLNVNDNDIAMMKVYPSIKYSSAIRPIGLPGIGVTPQFGEYMTVYGYGYTVESGSPSEYLRSVSLPVFPHDECAQIYSTVLNVTWQMLCAGYRDGGRDACVLDSGGPLVWRGTLQGLVSWGWGCARALSPGVFTDLSAPLVQNWIQSVIWT